ncbi:sulfotransferase family 2 domain-containing protein [Vibrio cyclitrophicus]
MEKKLDKIKSVYRKFMPVWIKVRVNRLRGYAVYNDYNDQLRCIFVHIPKTAGTSMQESLFNYSHTGHCKWDVYKAENSQKFKDYYKFAFVRNPFDRLVSAYFYLRNGGRNEGDKAWSDKVLINYPTFEDFVMNWLNDYNINTWNHFAPQSDYIFDKKNNQQVDFIGKFENINEDFKLVARDLGLDSELSKVNKSDRTDYQDYYNESMIKVVEKVYARDLDLLGYKYEYRK